MNAEDHLRHLESRRSVRRFTDQPLPRPVLERVLQAAVSAPSPSNRQPWRFSVITDPTLRGQLAGAVEGVVDEMKAVIARSHHAEDFQRYGDFFFEPLQAAQAIIVPQYRQHDDLIGRLLSSGGASPEDFVTPAAMQGELACTSGAVMNLMNQAHAEGLGACWMAGPTVARDAIGALLDIRQPWCMLGAIALGWPSETPPAQPRKSIDRVVDWRTR